MSNALQSKIVKYFIILTACMPLIYMLLFFINSRASKSEEIVPVSIEAQEVTSDDANVRKYNCPCGEGCIYYNISEHQFGLDGKCAGRYKTVTFEPKTKTFLLKPYKSYN